MNAPSRASVYDRLRPHLDAADLIARLGLTLSRTIGSEAYCKPLCHESSSGESLQINLHTGRWNCKACQTAGVFGDLIQLVEYVQTGGRAPSRGSHQGSSPEHRGALEWLCEQFGVTFNAEHVTGDPGLDVVHLFAMAAHSHLLGAPDVLRWIADKWGFDLATVEQYGIGYMPNPILAEIAAEAARANSREAFRSSGLGWYQNDGSWHTRFAGRVLFPYLEHGRAVYLIGRSTPWTPVLDNGVKPPKYHKLSVHSTERPHVSPRITNDHLYLEPVMATSDTVVIAEGVADAVALSALGVPVVSPVTISFNAVDLERFSRKALEQDIRRVEILFDNELSGSGNFAARRAGLKLVERGIVSKILTLPLGDEQRAARNEVISALGQDLFDEFERCDPVDRKKLIANAIPEEARRRWILQHVEASKIDAAEWAAHMGPGAAGKFDAIRREGRDVIDLEIADVVVDELLEPSERADLFEEVIVLIAHIEDRLAREAYAGRVAKAAGKGVNKVEIGRRVAAARRSIVKPKRKDAEDDDHEDRAAVAAGLVLLPPQSSTPAPPPAPGSEAPTRPNAPAVPPPPGGRTQTDHDRYGPARIAVAKSVEAKVPEETVGEYVAQTITKSMGFTPFRTPSELFLVRGSERVAVGLDTMTPRFLNLLYLASGLSPKKAVHRAYIASAIYFLERDARRAADVSWSYVDASRAVYFPTGDDAGRIFKIEAGQLTRTRMSDARVPAVAGDEFEPFTYIEEDGGIDRALSLFRWTSISPGDRLVLVYWLACLPILRRVGAVPIVRIEGGSSSGKTRTVDAVSYLVNGRKISSVPTAAALTSRMSREMLTIDDNRETRDVNEQLLSTLLQATHLGAREKRAANSDTGTVIERVCGAILMNGVEPIHDGRSELASRMLVLRCSDHWRAPDSPTAEENFAAAVRSARDGFWSEAVRRCSEALLLDREHGERVGGWIEKLFGVTKIGRLSAYLRLMYLAWVAGLAEEDRPAVLASLADEWHGAFSEIGSGVLQSLLAEELAVSVVRYVFDYAQSVAVLPYSSSERMEALEGKYVHDLQKGQAYLGPLRATQLARFARTAGKELNAPRAVAYDLRAGQLERRLLDGIGFLRAAGYETEVEITTAGRHRYTFRRDMLQDAATPPELGTPAGETWGQS